MSKISLKVHNKDIEINRHMFLLGSTIITITRIAP